MAAPFLFKQIIHSLKRHDGGEYRERGNRLNIVFGRQSHSCLAMHIAVKVLVPIGATVKRGSYSRAPLLYYPVVFSFSLVAGFPISIFQ